MKLQGTGLIGNVVERMALSDDETGFVPAVGGMAGPAIGNAPKPQI